MFKINLEKAFVNFCESKKNYPHILNNNVTNGVKPSSFPIVKQSIQLLATVSPAQKEENKATRVVVQQNLNMPQKEICRPLFFQCGK